MTPLRIAAATAALAFLAAADANAAGKRFCNEYAGTSVEQFNRAQELGLPVSGPRWHGAFDLHKAWCRFVSEGAAQHEIDQRREVISAGEPPADVGPPPPADSAGAPEPLDDMAEPPSSDYAGEPPPSDSAEPPLSAPVTPPGSGEPGSALSGGGPPLSAPVTPPSPSPPAEEPSASDAGEPPPSTGGLLWEPAD